MVNLLMASYAAMDRHRFISGRKKKWRKKRAIMVALDMGLVLNLNKP